jgi:lysophospholipase L1-like esterase
VERLTTVLVAILCCVCGGACSGKGEKPIEFVYLALGASDATGVGAVPLTEGYVYLITRDLDRRMPGVFLMNLGIPGARIDLIKEQVRVATTLGTKADIVTLWTGGNDLVNGDDVTMFQDDLRALLGMLKSDVSGKIVVANLPDFTKLPRFRAASNSSVTAERVAGFNRAIEEEAKAVNATVVNLFAEPLRDDLVFNADGFHPGNEGHREIANQFLRAILPQQLGLRGARG